MFNKVEISISTYNRSKILYEWINKSIDYLQRYNIRLSVYDSSSNNETEQLIYNINKQYDGNIEIKYNRIDGSIRLDEKVLMSILNAEREYVWPMGDARLCDFESINKKVNEAIEQEIDYIGLYHECEEKNGYIYNNMVEYFRDMFWCSTLLGGMIFRKEIFDELLNEEEHCKYTSKYNRNDGFSYLGIFYDIAVNRGSKGMYIVHKFTDIQIKKTSAWLKRYFEVWCDNMCFLFDTLPEQYQCVTNETLQITWKKIGLDGWHWLLRARVGRGLTWNIYKKYKENGMLERVSVHIGRIRFIAALPIWCTKICMFLYRVINKCKKLIHK